MEGAKERLGVEQYSVSQFSLEQIFIALAKTQEEETGEIDGVEGSGGSAGGPALVAAGKPSFEGALQANSAWPEPIGAEAASGPTLVVSVQPVTQQSN